MPLAMVLFMTLHHSRCLQRRLHARVATTPEQKPRWLFQEHKFVMACIGLEHAPCEDCVHGLGCMVDEAFARK